MVGREVNFDFSFHIDTDMVGQKCISASALSFVGVKVNFDVYLELEGTFGPLF